MNLSFQIGNRTFSFGSKPPENSQPQAPPQTQTRSSPVQAWLGSCYPNGADSILCSPYEQSVWVYTVVSALAQTISAIPFRISKGDRSGETILTKSPLVDLFNSPHPLLNRFRFWEFIVTWYCLRGEVFIVALDKADQAVSIGRPPFPADPNESRIRKLLVLNPDHFRDIVQGPDLLGWNYKPGYAKSPLPAFDFLPEEVIHDFLPNPYSFWRGLSPLSVAMLAAQTDYDSANFMRGILTNNGDLGLIVRTSEQLSAEQHEQLATRLRERKNSGGGADRPLFLWGATEVIRPTICNADLQFMDNRKMNRQEICAAFFRMPQSLIGFTENANRSIAETERLNFIENSIIPLCARIEAAVQPIIRFFGEDFIGWFDTDSIPIMQQARRSRVDTAVKLFGLGYPINKINKALDLGLPHLSWGDRGYLPIRLQQVGEAIEPPPRQSPEPNSEPERENPISKSTALAAVDALLAKFPQLSKELPEDPFQRLFKLLEQLAKQQPEPPPRQSPAPNSEPERENPISKSTALAAVDVLIAKFPQLSKELPEDPFQRLSKLQEQLANQEPEPPNTDFPPPEGYGPSLGENQGNSVQGEWEEEGT